MTQRHYTSNMMKGGAMIPETLALLQEWHPGVPPEEFTNTVVSQNLLGKATRARVKDILSRVFYRRFAAPGLPSGEHIRTLMAAGFTDGVIRRLLYFHTALADDLLYDFVVQRLYPLYHAGRLQLDTSDAVVFIDELIAAGLISPPWSRNIKVKTARGLLAALRDFGLLEGHAKKRFLPSYLPLPVFLYAAHYLQEQGVAGRRLIEHPHWRLFLVTEGEVEQSFLAAHQEGYLGYYAAGGIVRVEWRYEGVAGVVRALAAGTHRRA